MIFTQNLPSCTKDRKTIPLIMNSKNKCGAEINRSTADIPGRGGGGGGREAPRCTELEAGGEDGLWDTAGHPEGLHPISGARGFSSHPSRTSHPAPFIPLHCSADAECHRLQVGIQQSSVGTHGLKAEHCFAPTGAGEVTPAVQLCWLSSEQSVVRQLSNFVFNDSGCALQFAWKR